MDALELLHEDHENVKQLFEEAEGTEDLPGRARQLGEELEAAKSKRTRKAS